MTTKTQYFTIDHVNQRRTHVDPETGLRMMGTKPLRHNGRAVVAYRISTRNGVSSIRVGVSFCSPVDEFSFARGQDVAFSRLRTSPVTVTGLDPRVVATQEQARILATSLANNVSQFPNWARILR